MIDNWIKIWVIIPCSVPLDKYMVDVSNRCCVAYFYILIVIIITDKYWSHHIICISVPVVENWSILLLPGLSGLGCYLLNSETHLTGDLTESGNHVVCVITQLPQSPALLTPTRTDALEICVNSNLLMPVFITGELGLWAPGWEFHHD